MIPRVERRRRTPRPAGGWLITYADLMTILVCFFVLIISFSIQDQVKLEVVAGSMRDAFGVAEERRYAGDRKLKGTPEQRQPGNVRPTPLPSANSLDETLSARPAAGAEGVRGAFETANADRRRYQDAKETLEKAILTHPLLRDSAKSIMVSLVDDGMQIVIVDTDGRAMFAPGAAEPSPRAEALLREVAIALTPLPNRIAIEGHADATGSGSYSPFELTAARANAARRVLEQAGFPASRIAGVSGRGEANPLYPENPYAPANRRIEIVLEKAAPLLPEDRRL